MDITAELIMGFDVGFQIFQLDVEDQIIEGHTTAVYVNLGIVCLGFYFGDPMQPA